MTPQKRPAMLIAGVAFYEAPSEVEGSPYWVDLWAHVNGYRIGLQVKPKTFRAASLSVYTGKTMSSQAKGHRLFRERFGGRVIVLVSTEGQVDSQTEDQIAGEVERLKHLPTGPHPAP